MTTKNKRLQRLMQLYKAETGNTVLDMDAVADWAMKKGIDAPKPKSPKELLAADFAQAAREEYRRDPATGWSYRANHALRHTQSNGKQLTLWVDIEDATRSQMHYSLTNRRQQMVGDGVQLKIDEHVWNRRNPNEEPLNLEMDFTYDIEERLNSPDFGEEAA